MILTVLYVSYLFMQMRACQKVYFLTIPDEQTKTTLPSGNIENVIACYTSETEANGEMQYILKNNPSLKKVNKRYLDLADKKKNSLYFYDFTHYFGPTNAYPMQAFEVEVKDFKDDGDPDVVYLVCEMIRGELDVLVACPRLSHALEVVKRYGEPPIAKPVSNYNGELFIKCFYLSEESCVFKKISEEYQLMFNLELEV